MNIIIYSIILFLLIIAAFVTAAYIFKFVKEFINNKNALNEKILNTLDNHKDTVSDNVIDSSKSILYPYIEETEEISNTADDEIKSCLAQLISVMKKMNDFICVHRDKEDDVKIMAEYYIPEMLKHIKEYYTLKQNGLSGSHETQLKEDLIKTINIIHKAYETVLSEFHENAVLAASSSLEALKAGIKMKGLA